MPNNNIYLDFTVSGGRTIRTDMDSIASGTRNTVRARFRLLDDWRGIVPTAIFTKGLTSIHVLTVDGECTVPNEMTAEAGTFTVSIYGGDLKTTITDRAKVTVVKSGYVEVGEPPGEPVPGGNVLSPVKTVDSSAQYIRATDAGFEYSADGETWETAGAKSYTHTQNTESTVWTIPHNLDFQFVSVKVINSSGNETLADISYTNNNIVTLDFVKPTAGVAIIRR